MQILFLMGATTLKTKEDSYPMYLSEIDNEIILERQISYCNKLEPRNYIFCLKKEDIHQFHVDSILNQIAPNNKIIAVNGETKGALCTGLLAMEYIDSDEELILMAIDDFIDDPTIEILNFFRNQNADVGLVSFNSVYPRYSFARIDGDKKVIEVAEKNPISHNALVSFYYFKKGIEFVESALSVIRKDNPITGQFYLSQAVNEMILKQKNVVMCKVSNEKFHSLKTELQFAQYLEEFKNIRGSK